jgi:hypothetical protein
MSLSDDVADGKTYVINPHLSVAFIDNPAFLPAIHRGEECAPPGVGRRPALLSLGARPASRNGDALKNPGIREILKRRIQNEHITG